MTYSTPRKMQRTTTGKRSRGKSQPRKLFNSGPSRTLVPKSGLPEIKRVDTDMPNPVSNFQVHSCFETMRGTGNGNRIGNSLNMKSIKVKFDLSPMEISPDTPSSFSIYIVRDTEPAATAPTNQSSWTTALFADPSHSDWRVNFRNTDYTERFQIVRKWDVSGKDYMNGLALVNGYLELPLNGAQAKYGTGQAGVSTPINTQYYVIYSAVRDPLSGHPVIRIREEFTD